MNNTVFFRSQVKPPCFKCPDRSAECHSTCEKYLQYEKDKQAEYEQHLKEVIPIWRMNEIEADRIERYKKYRGRKRR